MTGPEPQLTVSCMETMKERLASLDLLRGMTIIGMLIVNNQGDWACVYPPLRHVPWHGLTPADCVFPLFLFIAGVSLSFSTGPGGINPADRRAKIRKTLKRTAILLALGLALNLRPYADFGTLRFPGVLQRIALCYLAVSFVSLSRSRLLVPVLAAALPVLYWVLLTQVPVPGYGAGRIDPEGNLCRYLDSVVFGPHVYQNGPAAGFDPEGLLSTVPAVSTMLLGLLAGRHLGSAADGRIPAFLSAATGIAAAGFGLILDRWVPINKNLWTPSYVAVTAGIAVTLLALCRLAADGKERRLRFNPVIAAGRNSIGIYFLSSAAGILSANCFIKVNGASASVKTQIFSAFFLSWSGGSGASLLYSIAFASLFVCIAAVLDAKKMYFKI